MFSNRTSQNSTPWMDIYRKTLRSFPMTVLLMLFSVFSLQRATAQCDITSPPQPIVLTTQLNSDGLAGLDAVTMATLGITSAACPLSVYQFYDASNTFLGSSTILGGALLIFDCADITASPVTIFVSIDDDFTPGGNESSQVELSVTVEDNMMPTVTCPTTPPGSPYGTNYDGADNYDCRTAITGTGPGSATDSTTSADAALPDNNPAGVDETVTISGIPADAFLEDIRLVDVELTHSRVGNLSLLITAPTGESLLVIDRPGTATGTGDLSNADSSSPLSFNDAATTDAEDLGDGIGGAGVVCADNGICDYNPTGNGTNNSFADLIAELRTNGSDPNGTWTINVADNAAAGTGSFGGFELVIDYFSGLAHATATDNCNVAQLDVNYANPDDPNGTSIDVMNVTPGGFDTYQYYIGTTTVTYTATDDSGNTNTCSYTIEVADDEDPTWVDPQTTVPANYLSQITDVAIRANGRLTAEIEIECQSATVDSDIDFWTNDFMTTPGSGFLPEAFDNCDDDVTINFRDELDDPFSCTTITTHTNVIRRIVRRWTAVDDAGNELSSSPNERFNLQIYLVDNIAPNFDPDSTGVSTPTALAITAPTPGPGPLTYQGEDLTVNTSDAYNPDTTVCQVDLTATGAPDISVTAVDCATGTITYSWSIMTTMGTPPANTSGSGTDAAQIFPVGVHEITYTAVDQCGQTSTFEFTLNVVDNTPPIISGCPAGQSVNTDVGVCEATVQWTNPTAVDNCSGMMGITVTAQGTHAGTGATVLIDLNAGSDGMGGILAEGDFPTGTTTVTYEFTDPLGNVNTCSFDIEVTDNENPTIAGCADVTINSVCPDATVPDYTGAFNLSDNCPSPTATQVPAPGTALSAITLTNDTAPAGLSDGDEFEITLTPVDAAGNMGTPCTITATLADLDEPIPAGPLVNIDASNTIGADCGSLIVDAPTATDCNGTVIFGAPSVADGVAGVNQYIYLTGFTLVTWTYDDGNGNLATQTQTITVSDDSTPPTINAGPDRPRDTDLGVCTKTMSIEITEVFPTTAPYLDPSDAPGDREYIDNCGVASITYTLSGATTGGPTAVSATPVTFELGVTTVTYTATDAAGNSSTDDMIVTVTDNEDPVLDPNCWSVDLQLGVSPGDEVAGDCAFTIATTDTSFDPTPTDNCTMPPMSVIQTVSVAGGGCYTPGPNSPNSLAGAEFSADGSTGEETFTIGWVFTDASGNTASCFQVITIEDRVAPSITCVDEEPQSGNQVVRGIGEDGDDSDCAYEVQGTEFDPTVADNCGVASVSNDYNHSSTLAGAIFPNNGGLDSTYTITWTVVDTRGNVNSCVLEVTIEDDVPPTLSCLPGGIISRAPSKMRTIGPLGLINPFFTGDACTGDLSTLTVSMTPATFDCDDATNMPIPVTISVMDLAGNTATCNTTVTIQENVLPMAVCQNISVQLDSDGNASIMASELDGGSTDNCSDPGDLMFSASRTTFDCNDLTSPPTVTLTVTDESGNSSTCTATVTVNDTIAPNAVCQAVTAYLDASGNVSVDAEDFDGGSEDNTDCDPLSFLINGAATQSYSCSDIGDQAISLSVTDPSGNSATCMTTVTVVDTLAPTALCQDLTINLEADGSATIAASDFDGGSTDNCDPMGTGLSFTINGSDSLTVDCNNIGLNSVTVTVTDAEGNSATCMSTLTVLPAEIVEITVGSVSGPAGGTVDVPVTIRNFSKVRSLQFSLEVDDPSVASISAITTAAPFSAALTDIVLNVATFSWFDGSNAGLDLMDDEVVVTLTLDLIGLEGEMTDVNLINSPTPVEVTQGCGFIPFQTAFSGNDGDVTIAPNTSVTLSGTILTEDGDPVPNVTVNLTGDETGTDVTDANGDYEFTVAANSDVEVTPTTNMDPKRGVTSLDLAIIQSHIVNGGIIGTPYKLIAGNPISTPGFSLNITSADLALIQQVIVQLGADFTPNSNSWKFIESDYVFANPTQPWLDAFSESAVLTNVMTDQTDLDFVGIKVGDVNDTWPNVSFQSGGWGTDLTLSLAEEKLVAGQEYLLQFRARDFADLMAFQATLNFDQTALAFIDSEMGTLENMTTDKIGLQHLSRGQISLLWYYHEGVNLDDDALVFGLRFRALQNVDDLAEVLALSNDLVDIVAYRSDYSPVDIQLDIEAGLSTSVNPALAKQFGLYQNQPNPFQSQTLIGFTLPEATTATLKVMDVSGKLLKVYRGEYPAGYNELSIDRADLPSSGVLYYQLDTPQHSATRKMVILE